MMNRITVMIISEPIFVQPLYIPRLFRWIRIHRCTGIHDSHSSEDGMVSRDQSQPPRIPPDPPACD